MKLVFSTIPVTALKIARSNGKVRPLTVSNKLYLYSTSPNEVIRCFAGKEMEDKTARIKTTQITADKGQQNKMEQGS